MNRIGMTLNAVGLPTLVVGERPKDTLPLARDCFAIEVTKTNVALACSEGLTRTKRQSEVIRRGEPTKSNLQSLSFLFF